MTTIRIRTFTLLGLLGIVLLPWIFFAGAHFMQTHSWDIGRDRLDDWELQGNLAETIQLIGTDPDRWADPAWQRQLDVQLQRMGIGAAIFDAANREMYRSDPDGNRIRFSAERFSMMADGQVVGRVVLYVPSSNGVSMIAALAGLLTAFLLAGIAMRRYILKPLDRMSVAARQIAGGDLEVRLPIARMTEIAEVRDGFQVMVRGLRESHRRQAQWEEERRFIIAAVAHDLRTPLFALRGYLDGIEQGIAQSPDKLAKYVAVCKEKSAQLDRLAEDLFTFTKVEYLEEAMNEQQLDLGRILQRAVESVRLPAERKMISVAMDRVADDCTIVGDLHLLERAMNNLLDNAIRHTPSHGTILIQCCKEDRRVVFSVRDTGPGFTSGETERVFEPLYRGEASRNRSTGGAGLGLTISRRILRRHGGGLAADNHPAGGAVLSGWIPAAGTTAAAVTRQGD